MWRRSEGFAAFLRAPSVTGFAFSDWCAYIINLMPENQYNLNMNDKKSFVKCEYLTKSRLENVFSIVKWLVLGYNI